jgi:hypothetical protein
MLWNNLDAFPITSMWQVYMRPTSASDLFLFFNKTSSMPEEQCGATLKYAKNIEARSLK